MKKFILMLSLSSFIGNLAFAQDDRPAHSMMFGKKIEQVIEYSSCKELFQLKVKDDKKKNQSNLGVFAFGVAYSSLSGYGLIIAPVGLGLLGISAVKTINDKRMVKLIEQAERYVTDPNQEAGSMLKKLHNKMVALYPFTDVIDLAKTIVQGNEDGSLCTNQKMTVGKIKRGIKNGFIKPIELD